MSDYDENSLDSRIATLLANQKAEIEKAAIYREQMVEAVGRIEKRGDCLQESVDLTNGRVTALEKEQWTQRGFVAAIGVGVSAAWHWLMSR